MISELANHLWQSTLFVVAVWLLTMMCRRNQASVRYWLWFGASVKFLIPFTVLMALGDRLEWASRGPQIATPAVSATIAQVSRPFVVDPTVGLLSVQEAPRSFDWFAVALLGVWLTGAIAIRSDLCAGAGTRQRIVWSATAPVSGRVAGWCRRRPVHTTRTSGPYQYEALRRDDGAVRGEDAANVRRSHGGG